MRHTRGHTRNRRSHHALKAVNVFACKDCGALKKPHTACSACGKYKGKAVIVKKVKTDKKAEKKTATKAPAKKTKKS